MSSEVSSAREEDLQTLSRLFTDIDPVEIASVYASQDGDMSECMKVLAQMAKEGRGKAGGPPSFQTEGDSDMAELSGDVISPVRMPSLSRPLPASSSIQQYVSLDVNTLSSSFQSIGTTFSQGMTTFVNSVTNWVSDLASTFDTGWDEEQKGHSEEAKEQDRASVGVHSGETDHLVQRRSRVSVARTTSGGTEDDDDDKKDL